MSNKNELMQKVDILLGAEKELLILKGMLLSPKVCTTKDSKQEYYTFMLKTIKAMSTDEYAQGYNTYHCIMPVETSKKYTKEEISGLKNNEVLCLCSANAHVKKFDKKETGEEFTVNNITIYVNDLMLIRTIDNTRTVQKAINL